MKVVFPGDFNVDIITDGMEAVPDGEIGCASFDLASCPLFKQGAGGAFAVVDCRAVSTPATMVDVVDTINARDDFAAGFLYARLEGRLPLLSCSREAAAPAGRSCAFRSRTAVPRPMETSA